MLQAGLSSFSSTAPDKHSDNRLARMISSWWRVGNTMTTPFVRAATLGALLGTAGCGSDAAVAPNRPRVMVTAGIVAADGQHVFRTVLQFPSSGLPLGVAIRADGVGLVAHSAFSLLSVIDAVNRSIVGVIQTVPCPASVVLSPSGHLGYVTSNCSPVIGVIDVDNRGSLPQMNLPNEFATAIAVSPDGLHLYVGTTATTIEIIDTQTLTIEFTLITNIAAGINGIAVDITGTKLYATMGANVVEFDLVSHFLKRTFLTGGNTQGIALSKAQADLIVANDASYLSDVLLSSGFLLNSPTNGPAYDVVEAPSLGKTLATLPNSGLLGVYDERNHTLLQSIFIGGNLRRMALHEPSRTLVITDANGFIDFIR